MYHRNCVPNFSNAVCILNGGGSAILLEAANVINANFSTSV